MNKNLQLYQEYRPKNLSEIVGHDGVVKEIQSRFRNGNYPQVSYFSGLTGTGKTTFALNVAKLLLCTNKIDPVTPCNKCAKCKDINEEAFIEGTFMFNASNLDVDSMRDIDEMTQTSSWISDKKVIIIDEFQELNNNKKAQKNILKALEKPSSDIYFILLAMDDSKVDKSIKGRSVSYRLYPVNYMSIAEYLYNICSNMKLELDENKADILMSVAEASFGSVRQACSILERVVNGNLWIKEELVSVLHLTDSSSINDIAIKMIDKDPELFSIELNEEIISSVKDNLVKLGIHLVGGKLQTWEKDKLKGLIGYKNASLDKVMNTVSTLNEFLSFPYINQSIIGYVLLKLFEKKSVERKEDIPVVETKVVETSQFDQKDMIQPLDQPRRVRR